MQPMWLCILLCQRLEGSFENTQWRKTKQMQPMWLCLFSSRPFEDTHENTQWRKIKQMQPMWLCLFSGRRFEGTFENTQWRKAKQMQPMWLCILSCRQFEETFENTQWRKVKQMQTMWLCILTYRRFEETFENTQWRKAKQMQPMHSNRLHKRMHSHKDTRGCIVTLVAFVWLFSTVCFQMFPQIACTRGCIVTKTNTKTMTNTYEIEVWNCCHFRQLRTWVHDNHCYLGIKSDTGQHSQFLRCFFQPKAQCQSVWHLKITFLHLCQPSLYHVQFKNTLISRAVLSPPSSQTWPT